MLTDFTDLYDAYLLTYFMKHSPSWEANRFSARQDIPHISRNPKVHYRTHKRPPPVSILGQPNPVHIPTSHLLEIHPNIIHPLLTILNSTLSQNKDKIITIIYIYIYTNYQCVCSSAE